MKLLFITSEGFDTPNSINHLCAALLEDILKAGISVYSISSHKTGVYDDIPPQLLKYANFTFDVIRRKKIDRNNLVRRYLDELRYVFQAMALWKKHRDGLDGVLLQSNPNSVYHAVLLKRALKRPIILNLYDVFPGHAMSVGAVKNPVVFGALRAVQRRLYARCDRVVAMSEDMKAALVKEGVDSRKIWVISSWFDDSVFSAIPPHENRFFKKYALPPGRFYVQFAGLLGYVFDEQMFLDTADLLKEHEYITFLLIGDGNRAAHILKEIRERNLHNILYFPWQPLDIIADVYNACDIGFIPLKKGVIGNGIPSKACQLMAAGKVVLNSVEESDYTDLFRRQGLGVSITDGSPQHAAEELLRLYGDARRRQELGENARRYAYAHFSRAANTAAFVRLIEETIVP